MPWEWAPRKLASAPYCYHEENLFTPSIEKEQEHQLQ